MGVLFICKSEKDRTKNIRKKMETPSLLYMFMGIFFLKKAHGQLANSILSCLNCPKFVLIQAFMFIHIACKYEQDCIKTTEKT